MTALSALSALSLAAAIACVLALLLPLTAAAAATPELPIDLAPALFDVDRAWQGPDGESLPFTDPEQVERFLREAEVVSSKLLGKGSTGVRKVTLEATWPELGLIRAHAVFRSVDEVIGGRAYGTRPSPFAKRDSHLFEIAAYEVDRSLGLGRVPPTVRRKIGGRDGSLQLWIENAATGAELLEEGASVPVAYHQRQIMRVFDLLVGNWDRHLNNELFDSSGRLWFIDHTRSFLRSTRIDGVGGVHTIEATLYRRLVELDEGELENRVRPVLDKMESEALLARLEKLRQHFAGLIAERGEGHVLYDLEQIRLASDGRSASGIRIEWPDGETSIL
ncbi:MAG: hypothetical protein DWQ36_10540 [Acidobacteria bacterium]|nr:MAG: hypothetical protein DWQ30_11575 [Acidobacteriota bacterium]REK07937.1 MAG: hypothetical protein DWQ36_10540 [Acidobacteriota bacterium]